jgi:hypothetical protein
MTLTERQAYDAMFLFLVEYWERDLRSSDDLDGSSADPAMDKDWENRVERIRSGFGPPYSDGLTR